jgi:aryl-alcohol dehydrogenase-like predicted oxidoreductase
MNASPMIEMRPLGKTGIQVSPIGLGTLELGVGSFWQKRLSPVVIPQEEKNSIVKAALDGGINWFDTYLNVEQSLVIALKKAGKADGEVVIATKWWPFFRTAHNIKLNAQNHIQFLDGYRIGLYIVHMPTSLSSPEAEMNAMADLVESGKIQSVGVSNFNAKRMRRAYYALKARGIPLAANEVGYSLAYRGIETNGILETAKELGITIIAHSPLRGGLLTGKYHKNPALMRSVASLRRFTLNHNGSLEKSRPLIQSLEEIATSHNATPAQIALNWLINFHGDSVVAIPGATNVGQAESNASAMRLRLSDDDMARLDELSRDFR